MHPRRRAWSLRVRGLVFQVTKSAVVASGKSGSGSARLFSCASSVLKAKQTCSCVATSSVVELPWSRMETSRQGSDPCGCKCTLGTLSYQLKVWDAPILLCSDSLMASRRRNALGCVPDARCMGNNMLEAQIAQHSAAA